MIVDGNCHFGALDQFRDQLIGTFTELREKGRFADVTLVSEDWELIMWSLRVHSQTSL